MSKIQQLITALCIIYWGWWAHSTSIKVKQLECKLRDLQKHRIVIVKFSSVREEEEKQDDKHDRYDSSR